jgi:predicted PurR-regulated permease PerM
VTTGAHRHVRLTPGSAGRVTVVAIALVAVLVAMDRSRLVLYWLVTAAAAALLLDGMVRGLVRWMRRGLAVALVTVVTLIGAALLTYGVVDTVVEEYEALQRSAPAAAASLEEEGRLSGVASRVRLEERTREFLREAPERLLGSPADAARTAAARLGEAALVITLTVFMLVAYERFEARVRSVDAASRQGLGRWRGLDDGVTAGAGSARRAIARVVLLGAALGVVAELADVPAPMALALWMAWWRLLPFVGLAIGYAPLVLLLVTDRSTAVTIAVLLALAVVEALVRWRLGAAGSGRALGVPMGLITVVAFSGGVEMAGVVGAVVAVVLAHVAVGIARITVQPAVQPQVRPAVPA